MADTDPSSRPPAEPYTIHDDADAVPGEDRTPARRGGLDPVALVAGLGAVGVALLAMTGLLDAVDPRWVLALGAVAVGLAVLLTTVRRRTR